MLAGESRRHVLTVSRRQAILQTALQLFLTKGFTDTTMEDIRQLSGASIGSIYHHFENKEKIAIELYRDGRQQFNALLFKDFPPPDPKTGIKGLVYNYLDWFEQSPDLGLYVIQASSTEYLGPYVEEIRQSSDYFYYRFLEWLNPLVATGALARYPQHLYVPLAIGPCRDFIRKWLRTRSLEELHEAREPLAEATWQLLAPR
jgi:AcrR family transcriptional regulator